MEAMYEPHVRQMIETVRARWISLRDAQASV
jgi:hypothetical protein